MLSFPWTARQWQLESPPYELSEKHRTWRVISIPITTNSHHLTSSSCGVYLGNTTPFTLCLTSPQVDDPELKLMCFLILCWKCTAGSNPGPTDMHVLCKSQSLFLSLHRQPDWSIAFSKSLHNKSSTHTYLWLWDLGSSSLFCLKTFLNIELQKHWNKNKRGKHSPDVYRKVRERDLNGSPDVLH